MTPALTVVLLYVMERDCQALHNDTHERNSVKYVIALFSFLFFLYLLYSESRRFTYAANRNHVF